jgi:hypothetical protein
MGKGAGASRSKFAVYRLLAIPHSLSTRHRPLVLEALASLNWLAVVAATLALYLLGGLWYSPALFGPRWRAGVGFAPPRPEQRRRVPETAEDVERDRRGDDGEPVDGGESLEQERRR